MRFLLPFFCLYLAACFQLERIPPIEFSPSPTATINDRYSWQALAQGLEQRRYRPDQRSFYAIRIDPQYYDFRVHYRPQAPLTIQAWQQQLPDAVMIVNANFFKPDNTVLGLLISDGIVFGQSYTDRGGTFFVKDGHVGIINNIAEPYQGELFEQAIQAFPMLVLNGSQAYTDSHDTGPARRTIIGQDSQGRVIIMVSATFGLGLYNLSAYLPTTDIDFVNAFNLDGGGSTMLYIAPTDSYVRSFDPVPAVLAAYPRGE
jgi:uncharacterized protein YigE (DUF2233 family)